MLKKITSFFAFVLLQLSVGLNSYADSPYYWYVFNIPPYGSLSGEGIGYVLADAYIEAGFKNRVVLTNAARWQREMMDADNSKFCSTGSWKLPNTGHRVYSDSINNTVDYGVAVRPKLYKKLSNNGMTRVVSILDVIEATKSAGQLLIIKDRPVFGKMAEMIEKGKRQLGTRINYLTAAEGPVSMLKMADESNRNVDSVLIFPEEFQVYVNDHPKHSLEYMMLSEGSSFAPIRASCPDTPTGRKIIAEVNRLLGEGLRDKIFNIFQNVLPDIVEIRQQAKVNQQCIKDSSCKDPLID